MKFYIALLLAFTCYLYGEEEMGPVALFNGENLDGWDIICADSDATDKCDYFVVEDGKIHVYKNEADGTRQSFAALVTEESFSRYHLSLEYKWGEKKFIPRHDFVRDSGIMYHLFGEERIWPDSLEYQIQEGDTGDLWIIGARASSKVSNVTRGYFSEGELLTLGENQRYSRVHRELCWEKPGWNHVEMLVDGANAIFMLNGKVVNEVIDAGYRDLATGEWRPLTEGKILLQAEGAEIFFRDIVLRPLPENGDSDH